MRNGEKGRRNAETSQGFASIVSNYNWEVFDLDFSMTSQPLPQAPLFFAAKPCPRSSQVANAKINLHLKFNLTRSVHNRNFLLKAIRFTAGKLI